MNLVELAKSMYANEPCRICGVTLTLQDISDGAVFAGYSKNNISRSAHKNCWEKNISKQKWFYPIDDVA